MYYWIQQILFRLGPERAHDLALKLLQYYGGLSGASNSSKAINIAGIIFPNRLGLAAGFDKNAVAIRGLQALGFGFLEIGTVTPLGQNGNPKPRLFRLEKDQALVNRMGFNNDGIEKIAQRLLAHRRKINIPIGVNLGKNRDTPLDRAVDDYQIGMDGAYAVADYLVINISSPNTPGLRDLQGIQEAKRLLGSLNQHRVMLKNQHDRNVPLFVKLAPDLAKHQIRDLVRIAQDSGFDGVIATNTTILRNNLVSHEQSQAGGMSGMPLFKVALETVSVIRNIAGPNYPIIGVGGISGLQDAREMLNAGADLLQIYTSFIYQGPLVIKQILKELDS